MNRQTYAMGPRAAIRFELVKIVIYTAVFLTVFAYNCSMGIYW